MKKKIFSKNKNQNGITLIALVITVIVLLILAGISITMLSGDNGLLTKAGQARDDSVVGQEKEQIQIEVLGSYDNNGSLVIGTVNTNIKKNISGVTTDEATSFPLTVTYTSTGHSYKVDENGKISSTTSLITINDFSIAGTPVAEANIPIPTGFSHTEGTKDNGYVIQDGNGNEFVWVPVDKNQKITLKITSEDDITELKLYDPFGDEINLGTVSGNSYENTNITPTVNGGYYLKVTTAGESKIATLGVHTLYAIDTWSDYWGTDYYINNNIDEGYSLEDFLNDSGYSSVEEYKINNQSWMKVYSEPTDTIDYVGKVATNGGFYIGRYEASYSASGALSKTSTSTRTSSSTSLTEGMLWNYISLSDALSTAKAYNATLNSSLLTGAAWDRTLGWIYETGNKTESQIVEDSTEWGNFPLDTFSNTTGLINTGALTQTKTNNIFDLAGNLGEWTTEVPDTGYRIARGGAFTTNWFDGQDFAVGRFFLNGTRMFDGVGFRLALYL